jgi:membrane protein YqaA with SNARE-associated domain
VLNVVAYRWIESPPGQALIGQLRDYTLLGAFLVMLIANATIVLPVPWPAVLLPIAQHSTNLPGVVVAAALGSVIGESVAFFVGRSGRGVIDHTRFFGWVQRQLAHPWRAFATLFVLSAPPNPFFDIAGMAAGATGLPFWMFVLAVLLARSLRIWLLIVFAGALGL